MDIKKWNNPMGIFKKLHNFLGDVSENDQTIN